MFSSPLVGLVFLFIFSFKSVVGLHNVTIQENDPRIRYSGGGWTRATDMSDKPTLLSCTDGIMETSLEGSFLEFNFTGTAVYLNTLDGMKGTFKAVLDDKPFDFDLGSVAITQCRVAYYQTDLTDGPHRLVVFNTGNPSSLLFDSITYTASDPYDYGDPPQGSIPQSDAPFVYVPVRPQAARVKASGSWQVFDLSAIGNVDGVDYCADVVYQTTTIGSSLELRFNGTAVQLNLYGPPHPRGSFTVSIDGQNEVVDNSPRYERCYLAWQRQDLSPDIEHVLRIVNTGPANLIEMSLLSVASIAYSTKSDDPTVADANNNVPGLRVLSAFFPYNDQPTNPAVIAGAVAAGILIICFVAFVFYWARRDRLKEAAMKLDEEKAISKQKRKGENLKRNPTGFSMGDHLPPRRPSKASGQNRVVFIPPPQGDSPRSSTSLGDSSKRNSSDGQPPTGKPGRKVGFLEVPTPSRS